MSLRSLLLDTARLYADLEDGLHGVRTGEPGEPRSTSVDRPLPLDADVAEHRHLLVRGLRHWVARTRNAGAPTQHTTRVPAMVAILISRLDDMDTADRTELADNLEGWRRGARGRMDLPKLRGSIPLGAGTCPDTAELDGQAMYACGGELRVMVPADRNRPAWVQCRTCSTRWAVHELPAAADQQVPVHVAAELAGVTVRTIQRRTGARDSGQVRLGDALRTDCAL